MELGAAQVVKKNVKLYKEQLTLLQLTNIPVGSAVEIQFKTDGSASVRNVLRVLTSTQAKPKTLFDFDQMHMAVGGKVEVHAHGQDTTIWCALFAAIEGSMEIRARSFKAVAGSGAIPYNAENSEDSK